MAGRPKRGDRPLKLAIMQPYFLPYIGYYQLIHCVDLFVVYDNVQFTKAGWIHRNRFLANGDGRMFSLPLRKASDYLAINQRELAASYAADGAKIVRQLAAAYRKAPYFLRTMPLVEQCFEAEEANLFRFVHRSLQLTTDFLGIATPLVIASSVAIDHRLRGQEKVLAICCQLGADRYVNAIGGVDLYSAERFNRCGINLRFLQPLFTDYPQFDHRFVPWLSIIDVLMFNDRDTVSRYLGERFQLVEAEAAVEPWGRARG